MGYGFRFYPRKYCWNDKRYHFKFYCGKGLKMNNELRVEPILVDDGISYWVHPLIDEYTSNMEKEYDGEDEKRYMGNLLLIRLIRNKGKDGNRYAVVYTFDKTVDVITNDENAQLVLDLAANRLYSGDFENFFTIGDKFDECWISPDVGIANWKDGSWIWNT